MLRRYLFLLATTADDHTVNSADATHGHTAERVSLSQAATGLEVADGTHAVFDYRVFAGKPVIQPSNCFHAVTTPTETVYEDQPFPNSTVTIIFS